MHSEQRSTKTLLFAIAMSLGLLKLLNHPAFIEYAGAPNAYYQPVLLAIVFVLAMMAFKQSRTAMALKPTGETEVKNLVPKFSTKYKLKANFFLLGTPDEVLKCLVDLKLRKLWDYNILSIAKHPTNNSIKITYKSKDPSLPDYFEEISFKYFQSN